MNCTTHDLVLLALDGAEASRLIVPGKGHQRVCWYRFNERP